ncbi:MAG: protein kinase, partial [Actinomycetota bacterium]
FKPGNVMVAKDGRVLVLDFGLARAREGAEAPVGEGPVVPVAGLPPATSPPSGVFEQSLTAAGAAPGTPAYMSPEQIRGEVATPASDQFSFCVALHRALFDAWPYAVDPKDGDAPWRAVPPPPGVRTPSRWRRALRRGLALDPSTRFPDMEALLLCLRPGPSRLGLGL